MFTTKYCPKKVADFVGNSKSILPLVSWLLEWDSKKKKTKGVLISGLNGIGKSLLVELILKKYNYHVIHISIDEGRDKEYINQTIKPLLKMKKTFDGQTTALVVSDIDSCGGDYGFISCLTECLKETEIPILCICDNRYNQNIKPILGYCYDLKLVKPTYDEVYPLIYKVVTTENIKIGKSMVDKLYQESNGDIRFILNTLQLGFIKKHLQDCKNIQNSNIFDTSGKLLMQSVDLNEKYNIYWAAHDIHTLMIHENYIGNTLSRDSLSQSQNLSYSADALSDANLFEATMQNELDPYTAYNTIHATKKCSKKGSIKFPQFLGKISTTNKNKREKLDYHFAKFKK